MPSMYYSEFCLDIISVIINLVLISLPPAYTQALRDAVAIERDAEKEKVRNKRMSKQTLMKRLAMLYATSLFS